MKIAKTKHDWLTRWAPWVAAMAAIIALVFVALTSLTGAWGPERETFTVENPADYPVFNSMTNNPAHGDERNFVLIRDVESGGDYADEMELVAGREYEVFTYFHNNAHERYNTAQYDHRGIATGTRLSVDMPQRVQPSERGRITSTISAENTNPERVWDEAWLTSSESIYLRYVPASATIHSNGPVNGTAMPTTMFDPEGAYIGYSGLNGIVPGCADFAGYVTYRFVADNADLNIEKTVSLHGEGNWAEQASANVGDEVDFRLYYQNTGTTQQNDVTVLDELPAGLEYVAGSTVLTNSANPDGLSVGDNLTTETGINIGDYAPGGDAIVTFTARVAENPEEFNCEATLVNRGIVRTRNGSREDTAIVEVVVEDCDPVVTPPPQEVPTELPQTGPAEIVAGILGLALISMGVAYWIRSRNHYKHAVAGFTHHVVDLPEEKLLRSRTDTELGDDKHNL